MSYLDLLEEPKTESLRNELNELNELTPTVRKGRSYIDSIALSWELLTATEALMAISPPTGGTAARYRVAGDALLAWMAATRPTDPALVDETWTVLRARLETIRDSWRCSTLKNGKGFCHGSPKAGNTR